MEGQDFEGIPHQSPPAIGLWRVVTVAAGQCR